MRWMRWIRSCVVPALAAALCVAGMTGCGARKAVTSEAAARMPEVHKLVFVGFQAGLHSGEPQGVVSDPISGALFTAEPVSRDVVEAMTGLVFDRLVESGRYELISPGQARGGVSRIVVSDTTVGMRPLEVLREVGRSLEADAVLAGYLFRWREREGTDYAVNRPASVAFDLHLVSPADGRILWRGKFDKTQRSLLENVLELPAFFKTGAKWMTAETLALQGIDRMLKEMP